MQRHRRAWRLQRGEVPVADALEILDALPSPDSCFSRLHQSLRTRLASEAAQWNTERQAGAAGPTALCGDTLVKFYLGKLDKHFEPYKQRGKLPEYEALSQAGGSPSEFLSDVGQLEPYIQATYPKAAIADRFVNRINQRKFARKVRRRTPGTVVGHAGKNCRVRRKRVQNLQLRPHSGLTHADSKR